MIIDLILDRKDGKNIVVENGKMYTTPEYSPKRFYNDLMRYYGSFGEIVEPIVNALDSGTDDDVKRELCNYIDEQEYNPEIKTFINSVNWL